MIKLGGYKPIRNEIECNKFSSHQNTFLKLASNNLVDDTYLIPEYTPVSNQGPISSCVANACGDSLEILKGLEDPNKVEQVSRLFIYYNARNYTKETNVDNGCYISDAMDSLKNLGACREITFEYDVVKVLIRPTIEAYREANDNKITTYFQINSVGIQRQQEIESAIRANHPVVFGVQVSDEFLSYRDEEKIFGPSSQPIGGHAMIITGIRTNANGQKEYYVRNSWGIKWGINGHVWLNSNYIDTIVEGDCFVPTRMIDFVV